MVCELYLHKAVIFKKPTNLESQFGKKTKKLWFDMLPDNELLLPKDLYL